MDITNKHSKTYQTIVEWISYFVLLLIIIGPTAWANDRLVGDGVDLFGTIWFYWWAKYSTLSGIDPSFTDIFFHPYGKDIFAHTGNNLLDAYLSIPFQIIFGFPRYYNLFVFTILLANCFAFRAMASVIISNQIGVWTATILWMVNPFVIGELTMGRPTQCIFVFAFLSIRSFVLLHREPNYRQALYLGVWTALQGWVYWYSGYFLSFVLLWLSFFYFKQGSAESNQKHLI